MRKNIVFSTIMVLSALVLGCQPSAIESQNFDNLSLRAPSGDYIAASYDDLVEEIASIYSDQAAEIKLLEIDYLNMAEGYAATVSFSHSEYGNAKVVFMSSVNSDSDISSGKMRVSGAKAIIKAFCSCGDNSFPSSGCEVSVTQNPNGSVTTTCKVTSCSWGCVAHVE